MAIDRNKLKNQIAIELTKVREQIQELEEMTRPVSPENAIGRLSRLDAINNKSVNEASLRQAREKALRLEAAFERVFDDNFGVCTSCKQPIPEGRILLMPHAKKCVKCA